MQYFQAGVLVMNLEAFRYAFTVRDMLSLSTVRVWRWLDQDILNMLADGNYVRIDMRWNTLMDWKHLRREKIIAQDPQDLRDQYEAARANPAIVHYAGPDDRPWDYPDCDMGDYFWEYARRSAFVDVRNQRLSDSQNSVAGKLDRAKVSVIFKGIMPLFDKTFPPGTKRRTRAIKSYVAIGGDPGARAPAASGVRTIPVTSRRARRTARPPGFIWGGRAVSFAWGSRPPRADD